MTGPPTSFQPLDFHPLSIDIRYTNIHTFAGKSKWQWKIISSNRRYIFTRGLFSIAFCQFSGVYMFSKGIDSSYWKIL